MEVVPVSSRVTLKQGAAKLGKNVHGIGSSRVMENEVVACFVLHSIPECHFCWSCPRGEPGIWSLLHQANVTKKFKGAEENSLSAVNGLEKNLHCYRDCFTQNVIYWGLVLWLLHSFSILASTGSCSYGDPTGVEHVLQRKMTFRLAFTMMLGILGAANSERNDYLCAKCQGPCLPSCCPSLFLADTLQFCGFTRFSCIALFF